MPPVPGLAQPPWWTDEQLAAERDIAIENFRRARMEEPLEAYLAAFEERQDTVERLLETTVDLTRLGQSALTILTDAQLLEAFRYVSGPPISLDDLKVVANAKSLSPKTLESDQGLVRRLVDTVMIGLDRVRFAWVDEGRRPREDERRAAVLASAVLIASQRVATDRRSEGKAGQESAVEAALVAAGYVKVEPRTVHTIHEGPGPGEFCRECMLGTRKADVLVGLHDRLTARTKVVPGREHGTRRPEDPRTAADRHAGRQSLPGCEEPVDDRFTARPPPVCPPAPGWRTPSSRPRRFVRARHGQSPRQRPSGR